MSIESNKQLVLGLYAAVSNGDVAAFLGALADDVEYTFFGDHVLGRTFRGKDDILANIVGPLMGALEAGLRLHPLNVIAEGDQVVVEFQGEARTKDGRPYNNRYCMVVTVRDGKVASVREYLDTALVKSLLG